MRAELLLAALSLAVLPPLSGCAGNTGSSGAPGRNSAWIVGEPNSCSGSQVVAMTIKSVDGTSTVSGAASFLEEDTNPCAYPTAVDVPAGHHTIGIAYSNGNEVMFGALSLRAKAGQTYDISAHPVGTSYWFDARPRIE